MTEEEQEVDDEEFETSKALIDPEQLFRDKKLKNKTIADLAILGLEPYLVDLETRNRVFSLGNSVTKGGNFQGSIRNIGNFVTGGITVTNKISTTGNSVIKDLLVVKESSNITGNLTMRSNAVFAGKTRIAGNVNVRENIISSNSLTLAGTVNIKKQIITDGNLSLNGSISVDQIQSLSTVHTRGTLNVGRDIKAKKFQMHRAKGKVGGEIFAKVVGVGHNRQLKRYLRNYEHKSNLNNPLDLIKFIGKLIVSPFLSRKSVEPFEVGGDIIADEIFLENIIVHGDINARRITIGDNVSIAGKIEYSEELVLLTEKEYDTLKIEENELLYLDPDENLKLSDYETNGTGDN